jgi:hypothetical protein
MSDEGGGPGKPTWVDDVGQIPTILGLLGALVFAGGSLVVGVRLWLRDLPVISVIPNLQHTSVIAEGLLTVFVPAVLLGLLVAYEVVVGAPNRDRLNPARHVPPLWCYPLVASAALGISAAVTTLYTKTRVLPGILRPDAALEVGVLTFVVSAISLVVVTLLAHNLRTKPGGFWLIAAAFAAALTPAFGSIGGAATTFAAVRLCLADHTEIDGNLIGSNGNRDYVARFADDGTRYIESITVTPTTRRLIFRSGDLLPRDACLTSEPTKTPGP